MPEIPGRPKKWIAARGFTYAHRRYEPNDPVTDRRVIAAQIGTGRIIEARPARATKPQPSTTESEQTDGS